MKTPKPQRLKVSQIENLITQGKHVEILPTGDCLVYDKKPLPTIGKLLQEIGDDHNLPLPQAMQEGEIINHPAYYAKPLNPGFDEAQPPGPENKTAEEIYKENEDRFRLDDWYAYQHINFIKRIQNDATTASGRTIPELPNVLELIRLVLETGYFQGAGGRVIDRKVMNVATAARDELNLNAIAKIGDGK